MFSEFICREVSIAESASEYVSIIKPECEDLANRISGYKFKFIKLTNVKLKRCVILCFALSLALELISLSLISWRTSLGRHASERTRP